MRHYQSKFTRGEFIAWDGEGIGRGTRHEYVLLASSRGHVAKNVRGLSTADALDCLARGMDEHRQAIHVGFAISYDVNMMLRDLPKAKLADLWNAERCDWTRRGVRYSLTFRPRKFFKIERRGRWATQSGVLWDTWPFFQSTFVAALEKYGVSTGEEREDMRGMKLARSSFRVGDFDRIEAYNRDELRCLVALMGKLHASLISAGLTLGRWDGPGAIAAALLGRHGFQDTVTAPVTTGALDAMQYSYYGGRIECLQYGRSRRGQAIHHYDINSAYPAEMQTLPCRREDCGAWVFVRERGTRTRPPRADMFAAWHVLWDFAACALHPFPWRSANGGVYFPPRGEGWVWTPELRAAMVSQAGVTPRGFTILGRWEWRRARRCTHPRPVAWMKDVYEERQRAKERGDGAEHALKLGINSCYGKLAQRVGAEFFDDGTVRRTPPYHDLAGAGWITSAVRAKLYLAAMQAPDDILMLATDGIYSLVPLALDVSTTKRLGAWSYETHERATIVQSGVYFLADADGEEKIYSRGFDRESLSERAIGAAWRRGAVLFRASHERFIGLGAALSGLTRFALWRSWHREPRELALHPWGTKRSPILAHGSRRPPDPSRGFVRTTATDTTRMWGDLIGARRGRLTSPSPVPWRTALDGTGTELELRHVERAELEDDDSWQ